MKLYHVLCSMGGQPRGQENIWTFEWRGLWWWDTEGPMFDSAVQHLWHKGTQVKKKKMSDCSFKMSKTINFNSLFGVSQGYFMSLKAVGVIKHRSQTDPESVPSVLLDLPSHSRTDDISPSVPPEAASPCSGFDQPIPARFSLEWM